MKSNEYRNERAKREIVLHVLSGEITKEQARQLYGIKSKSAVLEWMRTFAGIPAKSAGADPVALLKNMDLPSDEIIKLKAQIKELEQDLKLSQLKGKAYQVMVQIAKEDFNLDLEKKFGAKQSNASK